jgi:phosphoribosylformimino-5-aminoimidazole carboxamide ribotide isomerase
VQLYPAIDVQGGGLARAGPAGDPVAAARTLARADVTWVHVVDLDRARGTGRNDGAVRAVVVALSGARVQLGGALEDPDDVRDALDWGVTRVIVGARAARGLRELAAVIDTNRLGVAVEVGRGVPPSFPLSRRERGTGGEAGAPEALVERAVEAGVTTVVYRNHDRDGTLRGADAEGAARLLGRGADIVLAGGVAALDELERARDRGFAGVIVGRALLAGRFTLEEALACCG